MIMRAARLAILIAFAFMPLAQAVDCIMHAPAPMAAGEHADGHAHHDAGHEMPVAACFAAAMEGVQAGEVGFKLPLFPVDAGVQAFASPRWAARQPQTIAARWRGPPHDVLLTTRRLRI